MTAFVPIRSRSKAKSLDFWGLLETDSDLYRLNSEAIWGALLQVARQRAYFFGKHGERFDRRLYAEIESLTRIASALKNAGVLEASRADGLKLYEIEKGLREQGDTLYYEFP